MKPSLTVVGLVAAGVLAAGGVAATQFAPAAAGSAAPGSAASPASNAPAAPAAAPAGSPAPARAKVTVLPQPTKATAVPQGLWVDGCDHNYQPVSGNENVCVPVNPPPGGRVDCAYLKRLHITKLRIMGQDRKNLAGAGRGKPGDVVCPG